MGLQRKEMLRASSELGRGCQDNVRLYLQQRLDPEDSTQLDHADSRPTEMVN